MSQVRFVLLQDKPQQGSHPPVIGSNSNASKLSSDSTNSNSTTTNREDLHSAASSASQNSHQGLIVDTNNRDTDPSSANQKPQSKTGRFTSIRVSPRQLKDQKDQ